MLSYKERLDAEAEAAGKATPGFFAFLAAYVAVFLGLAALFAYALSGAAHAQQTGVASTAPPIIRGFGTLSVSATTSTLLSTITPGPNSVPWPTVTAQVFVLNQTAGTLYVCPLGGTCSASNGLWVLAGNAYGFNGMSTNATIFAASSGTVQAQW